MVIKQMRNEQLTINNEGRAILSLSSLCSLLTAHCSSIIRFAFCSLLIANCSFELQAQSSGYFMDSSGGEIRFIQRLAWIGDEYARRYEVIIEREEEEEYKELLREFTTASFIEVSLLPGKYRFLVIPYDFLNQSGERSEWMYIEVLTALYPELAPGIISDIDLRSDDTVYEMHVLGKNLVSGAIIFLLGPGGEHIFPSEVYINEDGSEVQIFFDKDQLTSGDYELIVKNPGGLETSKGGITVIQSPTAAQPPADAQSPAGHSRKIKLYLTAAWMPSFTIYDEENRFLGEKMSFLGAAGNFGAVLEGGNYINPGLELAASFCAFDTFSGGQARMLAFGLNMLALKQLHDDRMILTFRLGAGYSITFSDGNDTMELTDSENAITPFSGWKSIHTNIGVSFIFFVLRHLYLETGLDYAHWFTDSPSGSFRPRIGVGYKF
jgi:hypothetical protein